MKHFTNRIEEHMTEHPHFASRKTPVLEAAAFMHEMGFRHLPVVENGKVVGVVSDRDLKQAKLYAEKIPLALEDVMIPDPYCVHVGTALSVVAEHMANYKYGCAVILNDQDKVVGIFTTTDAMKILGKCIREFGMGTIFSDSVEKFLTGQVLI